VERSGIVVADPVEATAVGGGADDALLAARSGRRGLPGLAALGAAEHVEGAVIEDLGVLENLHERRATEGGCGGAGRW
jgi:hypothetical protein